LRALQPCRKCFRTPHCAGAGLGESATAPIGRCHPNLGRGLGICFVCLPLGGLPPPLISRIGQKFEISTKTSNLALLPFSNDQSTSERQTCAPFSTQSWPPRFPSSQVRLPPAALRGRALERGGDRSWFGCILWGPADGVGRSRLGAARPPGAFFMECSRLVCRHRPRPRAGASKPDRSDGPRWATHLIAGRQSGSQARACIVHHVHLSLRHRRCRAFLRRRFVSALGPCMAGSGGRASWTGTADRTTPSFYAALGLVPALTLPSQIVKACVRLGSKQPSNPARTDDSTDPLPISMALPRLSTRHFGLRWPAQVWTDAAPLAPLPLFGPMAREGDGTGQRFVAPACARCRSAPSPRCC
jgi:hypothetical protein